MERMEHSIGSHALQHGHGARIPPIHWAFVPVWRCSTHSIRIHTMPNRCGCRPMAAALRHEHPRHYSLAAFASNLGGARPAAALAGLCRTTAAIRKRENSIPMDTTHRGGTGDVVRSDR